MIKETKHVIEYSIEYVESKPLFKIHFGIKFLSEIQSSESATDTACKYYQKLKEKSSAKISGPLLFGLKLSSVKKVYKSRSLNIIHSLSELIEKIKRIEAVVKSLDKRHISKEAYQRARITDNNILESIEKGNGRNMSRAETYESLKNVLAPLIAELIILKESSFCQDGNT
ncbi:hypothetical protein C1645_826438 [Glomus cerebriforme]|uniref:Uncharacterized protein n=1 Tax=Glomus cerebriforme TaxID=658196 RepID=A0A397SQG4_9GLOM|nr:hypothetical protein C1645_826438 [Glomus cerebriforme]